MRSATTELGFVVSFDWGEIRWMSSLSAKTSSGPGGRWTRGVGYEGLGTRGVGAQHAKATWSPLPRAAFTPFESSRFATTPTLDPTTQVKADPDASSPLGDDREAYLSVRTQRQRALVPPMKRNLWRSVWLEIPPRWSADSAVNIEL
jgi:hypothetical protein